MKIIFFTALLSLVFAACSKSPDSSVRGVELRILPQVSSGKVTRAVVNGATFGLDAQVGLRVESSATTLHNNYNSFYAQKDAISWKYIIGGVDMGRKLAGFSNWGTVKVMGYYPYDQTVTDFDAIPFRVADDSGVTTREVSTTDYMVAATQSKTMMNSEPEVTLQFEHLMTRLELYMYRTYIGPQLTLAKVVLEMDNRNFVVAGTYDAKDPVMTDPAALITSTKTSKKLDITVDYRMTVNSGIYTVIPITVMPQLAAAEGDAEMTITLYFNDTDGNPFLFDDHGNPTMKFKLSDIDGGKGFLRGGNYRLSAALGTYVHLDGVPVVRDWVMDENTDPEHIDI